jgi:hypothetical protein
MTDKLKPFWFAETTLDALRGLSFIGTAHSETIGDNPFEDIWLDETNEDDPKLVRQFGEDAALRASMPIRLFRTACLSLSWQRAMEVWQKGKGEHDRLREIANKTASGFTPSGSQNAELAERVYRALLEAAGLIQA